MDQPDILAADWMAAPQFWRGARLVILLFSGFFVPPAMADNLVVGGSFDTGPGPFWATSNLSLVASEGTLCANIPGGTLYPWDAVIGVNDLPLEKGVNYQFSFTASGRGGGPMRALVQLPAEPWTAYIALEEGVTDQPRNLSGSFAAPVTLPNSQIAFQLGGATRPWTFCLDNVALIGGAKNAAYSPDTGPAIRVNQVGYLPDGPKKATLVTNASDPQRFSLRNAGGVEIASGLTVPKGFDPSAGVRVHVADFSSAKAVGTGFTLKIGDQTSYPFAIDAHIYDRLPIDALSYYYLARSGVEIRADIVGKAYTRPAGHISNAGGPGPNLGDINVPCQSAADSLRIYGEPWTCAYRLDVSGGWYDAGDHAKYVVNGGISVGQILRLYERALHRQGQGLRSLADSTLPVPERGNGVPDILDEVRWELEWMLKMVVPAGDKYAGMVHHKLQDKTWTPLPLMPHLDLQPRELHRPSTAATLNLAAVAAQGARLYKPYDPAFAERLLATARTTYAAALRHPRLYAPAADQDGGGPYDDTDMRDEFYWAAAELFITTGEDAFRRDLMANAYWFGDPYTHIGMDWGHVAGFAKLELATIPNGLSASQLAIVRASIVKGADRFLGVQHAQPFGQAYGPEDGLYDWGSNHLVLQAALVLATAYEMTANKAYRDAALESMDYVFGRNALNISYVTGYGTKYAENQHSRWFANQLNSDLPHPPKGALAGGPNSSIQDPLTQRLFAKTGCAAQTCYIDNIQSWSTNEITINWNAALAEMAGFLADH